MRSPLRARRRCLRIAALFGALGVLAVCAAAQETKLEPKEILQKTLNTYASAKTYQGTWTYTQERNQVAQRMLIEVKSSGPSRLLFRASPAPDNKPVPGVDPIPEMIVVLDGKNAWFQNTAANEYFKVPLPKNPKGSPLMFFPNIPTASTVQRAPDLTEGGKTYHVLRAQRPDTGVSTMEIEAATFRIRRITAEKMIGAIKEVATLAMEKETFDADIPDSLFVYKIPKDAREISAPPGATALFGGK
jgi:outer membrane lipoprotein-sorting protein